MKAGDIVVSSNFTYGEVKNVYHVGTVGKNMVDIEVMGPAHPARIGLRESHYEEELIILQEAQDV